MRIGQVAALHHIIKADGFVRRSRRKSGIDLHAIHTGVIDHQLTDATVGVRPHHVTVEVVHAIVAANRRRMAAVVWRNDGFFRRCKVDIVYFRTVSPFATALYRRARLFNQSGTIHAVVNINSAVVNNVTIAPELAESPGIIGVDINRTVVFNHTIRFRVRC